MDDIAGVGSTVPAGVRPLGEPGLDDAAVWAVLEAASDGMLIADDRGSVIVVNGQLERLLDYDRDALLSMTWYHSCPLATDAGADEFRQRIELAPGEQVEIELVVCTCHGEDVPVASHFRRSIDMTTGAVVSTVIVRDIRERRAWEAQLTASEEAFRIAFEQAPIGMAVTGIGHDNRRTIVQANDALARSWAPRSRP